MIIKIVRGNCALKRYAGKFFAIGKSRHPNAGNVVRYGYAGKADAFVKSVIPNAGNIVEIALNNSCWRFALVLILYPVRN